MILESFGPVPVSFPRTFSMRSRSDQWAGLAFASPWVAGFVLLVAFPFLGSLILSFCRWDMIQPVQWAGLDNYRRLVEEFSSGTGVAVALGNTAYYAALAVPLSVIFGIVLALMLTWPVRGLPLYRTILFLPTMIPVLATSILWIWLLDPRDGWINAMLAGVGLPPQNWLHQADAAFSPAGWLAIEGWFSGGPLSLFGSKDALVLMSLWTVGNFMVVYLAALGDIPQSLYEAAEMDGAGRWARFWRITWPQLTPVILFNVIVGLIRSVQLFTSIYVLSEGTGAPQQSLLMISLHLFLTAFVDLDMGYASALAWILLVTLVAATWLLFRTSRHWVHYRYSP